MAVGGDEFGGPGVSAAVPRPYIPKELLMSYETVMVEVNEFVGRITLNRPEQFNTFSTTLGREFNAALQQMESDPDVRVVVVTGAGKAFCAGIDVSEYPGKTESEYRDWVAGMMDPLITIRSMSKPVIARVNGVAAANGAGLVAACDLAVASEKARIGTTAINVGLFCHGPAIPLRTVVTGKQALEMLLTGDLLPAGRCYEMGLVNRVVPPESLDEATDELAAKLVAKSCVALRMGKRAWYDTEAMDFNPAMEYMNEDFARLCVTEDAAEGVAAFLEKRDPAWKSC
jgi:enoyl-CoA hydratase/carnithine racemase